MADEEQYPFRWDDVRAPGRKPAREKQWWQSPMVTTDRWHVRLLLFVLLALVVGPLPFGRSVIATVIVLCLMVVAYRDGRDDGRNT